MQTRVIFSKSALHQMSEHVVQTYPHEGCGILLGKKSEYRIEQIKSARNTVSSGKSSKHFRIDPLAIYELEKRAETEGLEVLGFYHSHPDCVAILSKEDEEYMIPEMLYVIISITNHGERERNGYWKTAPDGKVWRITIEA